MPGSGFCRVGWWISDTTIQLALQTAQTDLYISRALALAQQYRFVPSYSNTQNMRVWLRLSRYRSIYSFQLRCRVKIEYKTSGLEITSSNNYARSEESIHRVCGFAQRYR